MMITMSLPMLLMLLVLMMMPPLALGFVKTNRVMELITGDVQYSQVRFGIDTDHANVISIDLHTAQVQYNDKMYLCADTAPVSCFRLIRKRYGTLEVTEVYFYDYDGSPTKLLWLRHEPWTANIGATPNVFDAFIAYTNEFKRGHLCYYRDPARGGAVQRLNQIASACESEFKTIADEEKVVRENYIPWNIHFSRECKKNAGTNLPAPVPDSSTDAQRTAVRIYPMAVLYFHRRKMTMQKGTMVSNGPRQLHYDMNHCMQAIQNDQRLILKSTDYFACDDEKSPYAMFDWDYFMPRDYFIFPTYFKNMPVSEISGLPKNLIYESNGLPILYFQFATCEIREIDTNSNALPKNYDGTWRMVQRLKYAMTPKKAAIQIKDFETLLWAVCSREPTEFNVQQYARKADFPVIPSLKVFEINEMLAFSTETLLFFQINSLQDKFVIEVIGNPNSAGKFSIATKRNGARTGVPCPVRESDNLCDTGVKVSMVSLPMPGQHIFRLNYGNVSLASINENNGIQIAYYQVTRVIDKMFANAEFRIGVL